MNYKPKINNFNNRKNCDSEGIDTRALHYYSAREDMRRGYKELRTIGGTKYYDNLFWENYVEFFYNICNCMQGNVSIY